jgi:hypothetical protein
LAAVYLAAKQPHWYRSPPRIQTDLRISARCQEREEVSSLTIVSCASGWQDWHLSGPHTAGLGVSAGSSMRPGPSQSQYAGCVVAELPLDEKGSRSHWTATSKHRNTPLRATLARHLAGLSQERWSYSHSAASFLFVWLLYG